MLIIKNTLDADILAHIQLCVKEKRSQRENSKTFGFCFIRSRKSMIVYKMLWDDLFYFVCVCVCVCMFGFFLILSHVYAGASARHNTNIQRGATLGTSILVYIAYRSGFFFQFGFITMLAGYGVLSRFLLVCVFIARFSDVVFFSVIFSHLATM